MLTVLTVSLRRYLFTNMEENNSHEKIIYALWIQEKSADFSMPEVRQDRKLYLHKLHHWRRSLYVLNGK